MIEELTHERNDFGASVESLTGLSKKKIDFLDFRNASRETQIDSLLYC